MLVSFLFLTIAAFEFLHLDGLSNWSEQDTLHHSVIYSHKEAGKIIADSKKIQSILSPLGEGDPIRWTQTLSGVSTGADGSGAFYVRGGNLGGNLITLDGIPVYGYSHLLGLTSVIPPSMISAVSFIKGGFLDAQGNFTSSHVDIKTQPVHTKKKHASAKLNTFLAGAEIQGGSGNRFVYSACVRFSPIGLEYNLFRRLTHDNQINSISQFQAGVYDISGTLSYHYNKEGWCSFTGLITQDSYSFKTSDNTEQSMGWRNRIGILRAQQKIGRASLNFTAAVNSYNNNQDQINRFRNHDNHFQLNSTITEWTVSANSALPLSPTFDIESGIKCQFASFAPGSTIENNSYIKTVLSNFFLKGSFTRENLKISGLFRENWYYNNKSVFIPDLSLAARWTVFPFLIFESTLDYASQFYHLLEGLPIGWSIDMIVPTTKEIPQESTLQFYAGVSAPIGKHRITAGFFFKTLSDLVYFRNAENFFSASLSDWESLVESGKGKAHGLEFEYNYSGDNINIDITATWFRAMRMGFNRINDGEPFHAPFDRGFSSNSMINWKHFFLSFIFQGGNWVNGRGERYMLPIVGNDTIALEYFKSINTHQMSPVLRIDVAYEMEWKTKVLAHNLRIGICNVLNHFNPFTVYFDTVENTWKELALLPILPNFSYTITFSR